ncbi:MAG: bis(5'-nucleosyl)-tetraphosphatase (symmetrical) YqeK [Peptococcaceae bacterium]|jgi:predicted HD superfamily hydrolase involved in NAD metabolism|nr:bis(5'-nucleosyl)-tetraphosphatase (symmetrical) YqeK [Peptococcaceae bacterium]
MPEDTFRHLSCVTKTVKKKERGTERVELDLKKAERLAAATLSAKRFRHSEGVAAMAARLAGKHGLDPLKAAYVGWTHDIAKEVSPDRQVALVSRWQLLADPDESRMTEVLHGPLAAYWLEKYYQIEDQEVLSAVANHTLGVPGMSRMDLLLYGADKVEVHRSFPEADYLRRALYEHLEQGALACMEYILRDLRQARRPIHPLTQAAYEDLKERLTIESR